MSRILLAPTILLSVICVVGCGSGSASPPTPHPRLAEAPRSSGDRATTNKRKPNRNADSPSSSKARYLIIHADDAGLCHSVNRATIEALERGVVSSASMMVPAPSFEEFARYAREHPERDYGIHLTLNAEFRTHRWRPLLPRKEVPGLVDPEGYMWQTERQTAAHATADEVERELTAQIERALALGVPISHFDTHMGTCFTRTDFLEVYVNLGLKYKLPVLVMRDKRILRQFPAPPEVIRGMDDVVRTLEKHQLPVLDAVSMYYSGGTGRQRRDHYFDVFRTLPAGVTELIVHCGYADADLYAVTTSVSIREGDRQVMTAPETARELARLGVKLIDWKEFRKMTGGEEAEKKNAKQESEVKKDATAN